MRVCDAAYEVLRETNNPAVMFGDEGLCHLIARRCVAFGGRFRSAQQAWITSNRVLAALSRQPGKLIAGYTRLQSGRRVRIFRMPEQSIVTHECYSTLG